jgi:hypothetical protein
MQIFWLYTGTTKEEAEQKAQANLGLVNAEVRKVCGPESGWADVPHELTAEPEINNTVYYYAFEKPPKNQYIDFQDSAEFDLESAWDEGWFLPLEL